VHYEIGSEIGIEQVWAEKSVKKEVVINVDYRPTWRPLPSSEKMRIFPLDSPAANHFPSELNATAVIGLLFLSKFAASFNDVPSHVYK